MLDFPLLRRIIRMGRSPHFLQKGYKETVFSKIKEIYRISLRQSLSPVVLERLISLQL